MHTVCIFMVFSAVDATNHCIAESLCCISHSKISMSERSCTAAGGLQRERKSRSCENLLQGNHHKSYHRSKHLYKEGPPQDTFWGDGHNRGHSHFECPVEVQTSKPLPLDEVRYVIEEMESEFLSRRKLIITGLPPNCITITDICLTKFLKKISGTAVALKAKDSAVRVVFPSACKARDSLSIINSTLLSSHKLTASYGHPDSLLFAGNLPYTYTQEDLVKLFESCGDILRCFIVHSPVSGLSKGYGFVEFAKRDEAILAKQQNATKVIGLRSLRVDFSDNGMQTCEDLHSQTLFVDRLPKGFVEDGSLKECFSQYGRVNFCQVAVALHTGVSRGFAFVDMSSSQEAEHAQLACNGGTFRGHEIRVSFGMPCRHGACILQHKSNSNTAKVCGGGLPLPGYGYPRPEVPCNPPYRAYQPFHEIANGQAFNYIVQRSLLRSSSMSKLTHTDSTSETKSWGIPKSHSAPSVLPLSPSSPPHPHTSRPHNHEDESPKPRKRSAPGPIEYIIDSVYDQPYIGQHQQGIPFLHPLKRMKTNIL